MDTQCSQLLKRIKRGPITPLEALTELGIMRLQARIFDLKQRGHHIEREMVEVRARNGNKTRVAQYTLVEAAP